MKQEEINKKIKMWKNILYVTLIPITCFFLGAFIWSFFGVCFGFMGTSTCYYGLDGFSNALGIMVIFSIYLIVPLILEILDIIFLIISIIKIIKYKKMNKNIIEKKNFSLENDVKSYDMNNDEIQKKLKKWKIILCISTIPIICFIGYALWLTITNNACFLSECHKGIEGFFFALQILVIVSISFVIPIILEILAIIFIIISIIKIVKYKKLLNK